MYLVQCYGQSKERLTRTKMIPSEDSDIDVEIYPLLETSKLNKHPAGVY